MRRVVVTGMGMLAPFGRGVDYNWENIVAGKSAIRRIDEDLELYDVPVKIAGKVPMGKEAHRFDPDTVMEPKEQRRVDKFILFGMAAGIDAMEDSGWKPESEEEQYRAGVMMGSGIGGLQTIYENSVIINENKSTHRVSPFFIPSCLINMISGNLSIRFGLKGPNHACVTACSTGTHAIGDAAAMIARGDADRVCGQYSGVGRFCPDEGGYRRFQRLPGKGFPSVGQGPQRFCHGRGRGCSGAGRI